VDGVQPELTFLISLAAKEKFGIANLKHCTSGVFSVIRLLIEQSYNLSTKNRLWHSNVHSKVALRPPLIKRAHGANKCFFVFFGFIPMQKSQRERKAHTRRQLSLTYMYIQSLGSSRTVPRPLELFSLFDALRGFDLHQIPSTKELTCLFG
jgi:hypothetical protein